MRIILAAVLAVVVAAPVVAQMSEIIEVRVTNVDVVVTDRAGKPVTGLTKDDFEIVEAGKPQTITNFYEIRNAAALTAEMASPESSSAAATPPPVPADVSRRRIVVFVDNYSIHPHARTAALQALEKSLDRLMNPGDQAMLVIWNNGSRETITPLTTDRKLLVQHFRDATSRASGAFVAEATRKSILENAAHLLEEANRGKQDEVDRQNQLDTGRFSGAEKMKLTHREAYSMIIPKIRAHAEQT